MGADLAATDFSDADLVEANFVNATLRETLFYHSHLAKATFTFASLEDVRFLEAELMGADFTKARLSGTVFVGSKLAGADFRNANGITKEQIADAYMQGEGALCPEEWGPEWRNSWAHAHRTTSGRVQRSHSKVSSSAG